MSRNVDKLNRLKMITTELVAARPKPLFTPEVNDENKEFFKLLINKNPDSEYFAFPGQVSPIIAVTKGLEKYKLAILLGEPGSGKSSMSFETMNLKDLRDPSSNHKAAFFTTAKLLNKMAREAYLVMGPSRVKCFEVSSDLKYKVDVKTGLPKKFSKLDEKKSKTKGITVNGVKRRDIKEGDFIPSDMRGKDITPKRLKGKKRFILEKVFPEDIDSMVVPEGMIYVFFFSKDSAKIGLSEEVSSQAGDICPHCGTPIFSKTHLKKYGVEDDYRWRLDMFGGEFLKTYKDYKLSSIEAGEKPLSWKEFKRKSKHFPKGKIKNCGACNGSLEFPIATNIQQHLYFQTKGNKNKSVRKEHVGKRLVRSMGNQKLFFMLAVDEVHEMQSRDSNQSQLFRACVHASKSVMVMTGTLSNGRPSSIFYILQSIMPKYLKSKGYGYEDLLSFVQRYGAIKSTVRQTVSVSGSRKNIRVDELPQINESIVSLLAPFTYWLQLSDLNLPMPAYSEEPLLVSPDPRVSSKLKSFKTSVMKDIKKYNPGGLKGFAQRFSYLENNPTFPFSYSFKGKVPTNEEETEFEEREFSYEFEGFSSDELFPKERELVERLKKEYAEGRAVLLYSIYNTSIKVSSRLEEVIEREIPELKVERMPDSVSSGKIEEWINNHPCDVLIVSPLKVSTGLDLVQFATCIFYESGANVRIIQQASRRPYRAVGQDKEVKIVFMAYQGMQAKLLELVGQKLKGAATVEGKQVDDTQLASVFDTDAEYTKALNELADEISDDIELDFSSNNIEPGKLRPNTIFEQAYIDMLNIELEKRGLVQIINESVVEDSEIPEEINDLEDETNKTDSETSHELEEEIPADAETIKVKQVKTKSGNKQLFFDFS